jgi:hypothetical protein
MMKNSATDSYVYKIALTIIRDHLYHDAAYLNVAFIKISDVASLAIFVEAIVIHLWDKQFPFQNFNAKKICFWHSAPKCYVMKSVWTLYQNWYKFLLWITSCSTNGNRYFGTRLAWWHHSERRRCRIPSCFFWGRQSTWWPGYGKAVHAQREYLVC